jgi:putative addiction module CopG family antidote
MARSTGVTLGEHYSKFIENKINEGRFESVSEAVRAGLRLLEDQEDGILGFQIKSTSPYAKLGSIMNKIAAIIITAIFSIGCYAENEEARRMWSDGGECAYDYMVIAVTASGEVWANKQLVGTVGLPEAITKVKSAKNVICIMVCADKPLDINSDIVDQVMGIAKNNHSNKVYFINEP